MGGFPVVSSKELMLMRPYISTKRCCDYAMTCMRILGGLLSLFNYMVQRWLCMAISELDWN